MYWTKEEDDLVKQWQQRQTPKEEYLLYKKLYTKTHYMCVSILNKYFGKRNTYDNNLYVMDALNHVFTQLDDFDFNRGSCFSFMSNIIKNRYSNQIYSNTYINNTDFDYNFEVLADTKHEETNNLERVLKHIDARIEETKAMYWKRVNVCKRMEKQGYLRKIIIGRQIKKYFRIYGMHDFNNTALYEWLVDDLNDDYNTWVIIRGIRFFINVACQPDKYRRNKDEQYLKTEKNWIEKLGVLNTDYCPNNKATILQRRWIRGNKNDNDLYIFW